MNAICSFDNYTMPATYSFTLLGKRMIAYVVNIPEDENVMKSLLPCLMHFTVKLRGKL